MENEQPVLESTPVNQDEDWNAWLNSDPDHANQHSTAFQIDPNAVSADPEAHVTKTPLTKNPVVLYSAMVGGLGLILLSGYTVFSLASNAGRRTPVAVVPQATEGTFGAPKQYVNHEQLELDRMKDRRDDSIANAATPSGKPAPNRQKVATTPQVVVQRIPVIQRVPVVQRVAAAPAPQSLPRVAAAPPPQAAPEPPIDPEEAWKESGETLYGAPSGEGPSVEPNPEPVADASTNQPIASFPNAPVQPGGNATIDDAIAVYDGQQPQQVAAAPVAAPATTPTTTPGDIPQPPPQPEKVAMADTTPEPIVTPIAEQKVIPGDASFGAKLVTAFGWDANQQAPIGKELKINVTEDFKKGKEIIVPKGSIVTATITNTSGGGFVQAEANMIQLPDKRSISIAQGMLSVETKSGFIQAKLHQPGKQSFLGNFARRLGQNAAYTVVGSVVPQGSGVGDQLIQQAAYTGLDTVNEAIDGSGQQLSPVSPSWMVKRNTDVELVARGDIPLQ
jgi:hypothetical protein